MTGDQQYNIGKKNPFQIDFGKLKSGIKAEEFKDNSAMLEIFNASDTNKNSVLDNNEVSVFVDKLVQAAGDDNTLSEKETKALIKQEQEAQEKANGQKPQAKVKANDVFSFLKKWQNWSQNSNVKSSEMRGEQRVVTYDDGAQEVINKDGSRVVTSNSGAVTTIASYSKDGKIIKKEEKNEETGIVETFVYDDDGNVKEHSRKGQTDDGKSVTQYIGTEGFSNGKPVKEIIDDGSEHRAVSEFNYTSENDYTKTTTLGHTKSVVTVENGEHVSTVATQYENGVRIHELSLDHVNDVRTETSYNSNGQIQNEVVIDGKNNTVVASAYNSETGRKTQSVRIQNGQEYVANYDGNGNTLVVVQNGETVSQLEKQFDRTQSELAASNKGIIHRDENGQYYFLVGEEIRVAGELDPAHAGLQGRNSALEEISEYTQQEFQRVASRINGREIKEVTAEKDYKNLTEFAIDLLKSEGITKPTKQQITDKTNELLLINGDVVPKKGQTLSSIKTDQELEVERQKAQRAEQRAKKHANAEKQGAAIAKELREEITQLQFNSIGSDDFQKALHKITPDNVVETMAAYDDLSPDESLAKAMSWEVTSTDKTIGKALNYILQQLNARAKQSGVNQSVINDLNAKAKDYIDKNKADGLQEIFQSFAQAIRNVEHLSEDEVEAARAQTPQQQQSAAVELLNGIVNGADNSFNNQLDSDGWAGKTVDWISGAWGSKNREKYVRQDIDDAKAQLNSLKTAKTEEEFNAKFKKIYGVDFDPVQIAAYEKMRDKYEVAAQCHALETSFDNTTKILQSSHVLREEVRVDNVDPMTNMTVTTVTATKEQVYSRELGRFAEFLGMGDKKVGMAQIQEEFKKAGLENASIDKKYEFLNKKAKECSALLHKQTMAATGGKDFSIIQDQYNNSYASAFGTKNNIARRVEDYNESQQVGAMVLKSGIKIAAGVVIGIATGGAGVVPLLAAAGSQAAISFAVDASDLATSKKGGTTEQYLTLARNAAIDGASQVLSGGASNVIKGANLSRVATYALNTAVDTSIDMGVEYLQTGEITWQSTLMSAGFSLGGQFVGDAIESRQQRKMEAAAARADIDPLNDVPANWSSMTQEERSANLLERQARHKEWLKSHPEASLTEAERVARINPEHSRYQYDVSSSQIGGHKTVNVNGADFNVDVPEGIRVDVSHTQHMQIQRDVASLRTPNMTQEFVDGLEAIEAVQLSRVAYNSNPDGSYNLSAVTADNARPYGTFRENPKVKEMGLDGDISLVQDAANLSGMAYNDADALKKSGWTQVTSASAENGFHAKAFEKDGKVMIAFRGSDDAADLASDFQMLTGRVPEQFENAKDFVASIKEMYPDAQIVVTGHSLGGALTEMVASQYDDVLGITFDAVGTKNIVAAGGLTDNHNTINYVVKGDVISNANEHVGTVTVVNEVVTRETNPNSPHAITNFMGKDNNSLLCVEAGLVEKQLSAAEQTRAALAQKGLTMERLASSAVDGQITISDTDFKAVKTQFEYDIKNANANLNVFQAQVDMISNPEQKAQLQKLLDTRKSQITTGADISTRSHVTEYMTGEQVNDLLAQNYGITEAAFGDTPSAAITFDKDTKMVRVFNDESSFGKGNWLMAYDDVAGLTPEQIKEKFALPAAPKYVVEIEVPAGCEMVTGSCKAVEGWGKGGGTQYFITGGQRPKEYGQIRRLPQ